jgi:hypothetical protein
MIVYRIATSCEHDTPFPTFWRAWYDNLGADTSPYGAGNTEAEAVADLIDQYTPDGKWRD